MTVPAGPCRVAVLAPDPLSRAGVASQLRADPDVQVLEAAQDADLVIVVADGIDDEVLEMVSAHSVTAGRRVVVVVGVIDDTGVLRLVEAGVCGLLRRSEATTGALTAAVQAAAMGDGSLPPDLLGRLLRQVRRINRQVLAPRGLDTSGLTVREVDVLRLLSEGLDNGEIAAKLSYSERTVKSVVHDVCLRLQARNRTQAVALAIRAGWV